MADQDQIQSVLDSSRWASRILSGKHSEVEVHLITFPGVVGGEFRVLISQLTRDLFGHVDVSIACTGWGSNNAGKKRRLNSYATDFQETESLSIENFSFEVSFLIPFEAQATEEGSEWHLEIHFINKGVSEVFEVPICRTLDSNPKMTSVEIAAQALTHQKHQQASAPPASDKNRIKPYTMTDWSGEVNFRFPVYSAGRKPVLAQGLCLVAALWAGMIAIICFASEDPIKSLVALGIPSLVLLIFIGFILFGVSYCKIDRDQLTTKHKLFGLPLNWTKVKRSDLAGFVTISLGVTRGKIKSQSNYLVVARRKSSSNVFICLTVFDQYSARVLAKELNKILNR